MKTNENNIYNAKVNDLYNEESGLYITQGIKKNKQSQFERSIQGKGKGSNGSYLMFDSKVTYTFLKLYIYDLDKTIRIDVRQYLKEKYNGRRLTQAFLKKLKENIPKKVKVKQVDGSWELLNFDVLVIDNIR